MALLLMGGSSISHAQQTPLDISQRDMQALLDRTVVPRIRNALTSAERAQLGSFSVIVTRSNDPMQLTITSDPPRFQLTISAGLMSTQDVLNEASIIAAMAQQPEALQTYSLDVVRHALAVLRSTKATAPQPLWKQVGWSEQKYQQVRSSTLYASLRYQGSLQTLSWLVSLAISERLNSASLHQRGTRSMEHSYALFDMTASLMLRSGLSPAPPWTTALLYAAANPSALADVSTHQWVCEAKSVIDAAIVQATRSISLDTDLNLRARHQRVLDDWRTTSNQLAMHGHCIS